MEYIATFFTHFGAGEYARRLRKNGVSCRMMPVPRKLSSSCGTCVRFLAEDASPFLTGEDLEGVYRLEGDRFFPLVENQ